MIRSLRPLSLAACCVMLGLAPAHAAEVRILASDPRGVTLQLEVSDWRLDPAGSESRLLPFVDGLERTGVTGRARLPFGRALLVVPPGARAIGHVISVGREESREAVHLAIAARSRLVPDDRFGFVPVLQETLAIRDGAWPPQPFQVGDPSMMRERRIVPVELFPFRYDEAGARLTLTHMLTVRVDFVGGTGPAIGAPTEIPDAHDEALFGGRIANWVQARSWRAPRPRLAEGGLLSRRAPGARTLASGLGVPGFDESMPEVRVRIDTTGVYELDYDTLAVYGYPAGVSVNEVSVHRHEFLENAVQPYETLELPIEVDDVNGNGVFDSGDRIVVWVWDWAQRSRASQALRCWGDAEVIYATSTPGRTALRIAHRSGWLNHSDLTPLASYPWRQRFKQNLQYMTFPPDTVVDPFLWTNVSLYAAPDPFPFETNQLDVSQPASLTVNWMGTASTQHINWATVTNRLGQVTTLVDSVVWSGLVYFPRTGSLPPGALSEGLNNTLRVWGKTDNTPSGSSVGLAGVHSFDLTYWRGYVPLQGYLRCNSGSQASAYEIRAGPFTDAPSIRAYDVTDSLNPQRLDNLVTQPSGFYFYLRLQDSTTAAVQRQYVICELPRLPAPGALRAVTRHRVFDHFAGDYLIIAPEDFVAAAQPLETLHAQQGLQVVMAPLEGVYDEFNGGRRSPYAIKRFIRYAYNRWNAKYVVLVGDGSEDPQGFVSTSSPDIVPVQRVLGPVPAPLPTGDYLREAIPGDSWYTFCLNCTDPSISNPLLDLSLGRLPAGSLADVTAMVNKIVKYDDLSGDQSWRRNILLNSDDQFSGTSTFGGGSSGSGYCRHSEEGAFLGINQISDSLILKTAGLQQCNVEMFNLSYYLPNRPGDYTTSSGPDTCRNSQQTFQSRARLTVTPALFSRLNVGQMWWNYQGHANEYVMSHESFYLNQAPDYDHQQFQNDGKPCLFSAFSCHGNSFARLRGGNDITFGPCFGERMVTLANRGAIASYASAGFELIPPDPSLHLQVFLTKAMFVNPPRDELLGDRGARSVLGEILQATYLDHYYTPFISDLERGVAISYNLLGDPATRLSIGPPQSLVTANAVPVVSGQDIRLHTPADTLRLEGDLVSNVRLDSLTLMRTGPGNVSTVIWRSTDPVPAGLTVTPAFPDTAPATAVTGGRRFHLTWEDKLLADTYHYSFRTVDRFRQATSFDADFDFQTVLQVGTQPVADGDIVSPTAALTLLVRSPRPLNPLTELTLTINGSPQPFTAGAANGDPSGREWQLSWVHAPYEAQTTTLQISAAAGATHFHTFRVAAEGEGVRLDNAMVFPNPFDDDYLRALNPGADVATVFSFNLVSAAPADVTLRIYTISGHLIYQRTETGLDSSYHQLGWNGLDAEGYPLANGVYFYKLLARSGNKTTSVEGKLVKLRRPHHTAD